MSQPVHSFPPFPTRFASLPARAPYNVLLISGWRPLRGFPSWPRRSNTGRLCPRSRASQVHKGQGRGKKRPGRRFHAPKHLRQPSLRSAAAKAGGSESRPGPGGGSQPPWKGPEQRPGCAEGSASVRFLFASQANHSQQLSPCLAALLMCFLLAEKTSRAAAERGGVQGGGRGTWETRQRINPTHQALLSPSGSSHQAQGPRPHSLSLHSASQTRLRRMSRSLPGSHVPQKLQPSAWQRRLSKKDFERARPRDANPARSCGSNSRGKLGAGQSRV